MPKKLINHLENRERDFRKRLGHAKKNGDDELAKYYQGHIHEIETLLFILRDDSNV